MSRILWITAIPFVVLGVGCSGDVSEGNDVFEPTFDVAEVTDWETDYPHMTGPWIVAGSHAKGGRLICRDVRLELVSTAVPEWELDFGHVAFVHMRWDKERGEWTDFAMNSRFFGIEAWSRFQEGRGVLEDITPSAAYLVDIYTQVSRDVNGMHVITGAEHRLWCLGPDYYRDPGIWPEPSNF